MFFRYCVVFMIGCSSGGSLMAPDIATDKSCEVHARIIDSSANPAWVRMAAHVEFTCYQPGLHDSAIRTFNTVDHFPSLGQNDISRLALCNSGMDFEFYLFPEDLPTLIVDAWMSTWDDTAPSDRKSLYCEASEYPWRSQ
jgi:hypothetical protein